MMDAKARLANLLDRIVECEAERRVALTKRDDARADNWEFRREQARSEALALLDTEPVPPPQPAGPITSEEAMIAYERAFQRVNAGAWFDPDTRVGRRVALDAAMPLLARDHGLLTPAEVERRARVWRANQCIEYRRTNDLVAALTAREATSAASTREAK